MILPLFCASESEAHKDGSYKSNRSFYRSSGVNWLQPADKNFCCFCLFLNGDLHNLFYGFLYNAGVYSRVVGFVINIDKIHAAVTLRGNYSIGYHTCTA